MKKFSFISSVLLLTAVVAFLFIGCQKDTTTTDELITSSENTTIKNIAGSGHLTGTISADYAESLQKNYIRKFGNDDSQNLPLQVAFSAKDLVAFINTLQTKYKSDVIYVNFGVYGKGALAPNFKNNGRLTVFFTGNNIGKVASNVQTNGTEANSNEFLNHGDITPPPSSQTP